MGKSNILIDLVSLGHVPCVENYINTQRDLYGQIDVNKRAAFGDSPLLMAACRNDVEMVRLLISFNADVDVVDFFGNTPLKWAEKYNNNELHAIIVETGKSEK